MRVGDVEIYRCGETIFHCIDRFDKKAEHHTAAFTKTLFSVYQRHTKAQTNQVKGS